MGHLRVEHKKESDRRHLWVAAGGEREARISYIHNKPTAAMGRFGGGWQWAVGFRASQISRQKGQILIELLVLQISLAWGQVPLRRREE